MIPFFTDPQIEMKYVGVIYPRFLNKLRFNLIFSN